MKLIEEYTKIMTYTEFEIELINNNMECNEELYKTIGGYPIVVERYIMTKDIMACKIVLACIMRQIEEMATFNLTGRIFDIEYHEIFEKIIYNIIQDGKIPKGKIELQLFRWLKTNKFLILDSEKCYYRINDKGIENHFISLHPTIKPNKQ